MILQSSILWLPFNNTAMRLILVVGSNTSIPVDVDGFYSVRELLSVGQIQIPEDSACLFSVGDSILQPDLSLSCQKVQDGDKISISFRKLRLQHPRHYIQERVRHADKLAEGFTHESYRVADASFLRYESFFRGEQCYERMMEIINGQENDFTQVRCATHVEKSSCLNEHPLPICWKDPHDHALD